MTWFEHLASLIGVSGGVLGVVTFLLMKVVGLDKVLANGSVTVETVVHEAEKLDPNLVSDLKKERDAAVAKAESVVKEAGERVAKAFDNVEAEVQKRVADRLAKIASGLVDVQNDLTPEGPPFVVPDVPVPAPAVVDPPVAPPTQ